MEHKNEQFVLMDLKTTGLRKNDAIVSINLVKYLWADTSKPIDTFSTYIKPWNDTPISNEAFLIHHITKNDVKDSPLFSEVADEINAFIGRSDIMGFNLQSFDILFLCREMNRCGKSFILANRTYIDVYEEEVRRKPNTLDGIYKRYSDDVYNPASEEKKSNADMSKINAIMTIFTGQKMEKDRYGDVIPCDIITDDGMFKIGLVDEKKTVVFGYGKYKGLSLKVVCNNDINYIEWLINDSNCSQRSKAIVMKCLKAIGIKLSVSHESE